MMSRSRIRSGKRMIEGGTSKPALFDVVIVHSFRRFFPRQIMALFDQYQYKESAKRVLRA